MVYAKRPYKKNVKKQMATKSFVKRVISDNVEHKYQALTQTNALTSYDVPSFDLLNNIPTGTSDTTRIGDTVKFESIKLKGHVQSNTTVDTIGRCMVVQWTANSTPVLNDILQSATVNASIVDALPNHDNASRYKILFDKRFVIAATNATGGEQQTHLFAKNIYAKSVGKKTIQYIGGSATSALNRFYMITLSNASNASGIGPTFSWKLLFNYSDS